MDFLKVEKIALGERIMNLSSPNKLYYIYIQKGYKESLEKKIITFTNVTNSKRNEKFYFRYKNRRDKISPKK
jgi:hypothetical protein